MTTNKTLTADSILQILHKNCFTNGPDTVAMTRADWRLIADYIAANPLPKESGK
jgi:hypothetical protein